MSMNTKTFYDKNIILPRQSFIAYIFYVSETKELNVVLRKDGKQYRYRSIPLHLADQVIRATNKGSFIAVNIMRNKKYTCELVRVVPVAEMQEITVPAAYQAWIAK